MLRNKVYSLVKLQLHTEELDPADPLAKTIKHGESENKYNMQITGFN